MEHEPTHPPGGTAIACLLRPGVVCRWRGIRPVAAAGERRGGSYDSRREVLSPPRHSGRSAFRDVGRPGLPTSGRRNPGNCGRSNNSRSTRGHSGISYREEAEERGSHRFFARLWQILLQRDPEAAPVGGYLPAARAAAPRMPALLRNAAGTIGVSSLRRGRKSLYSFETPPPTMKRSGWKRATSMS